MANPPSVVTDPGRIKGGVVSLQTGQIGELEETPGLSVGAWQMRPSSRLCRGSVEPSLRHAGDQSALPLGRSRPARDYRRIENGPSDLRRTGIAALRAGGNPARAARCRAKTSCSTTRVAMAVPVITRAAPA
jgi:hypothetical protein